MSYQELFYPSGVAVFGSTAPGKLSSVIIERLIEGGMENIFAVNPKGNAYNNVKGYKTITEIPQKVDLAVIVSPAVTVKGVLEDCGKAGVKAAAIITSGFSEAGNTKGERAILEVAKKYNIRFVGPNCAGVVNTHANLLATLETRPPKGSMAIISQSGAVGGMLMAMAGKQGIGVSKFVSFGNGLDLSIIEFLEWMKTDDETKVIALYLESVKNGRDFMKVLSELTKIKPVVVVKSGRSSAGQRAALSHTGSMAGADQVFDAALKQCGAIRVESLEDMFDICKGFSYLPHVKGNKVLIVTNSGGPGVMAADKAEVAGMELPETSEMLKEELYTILPPFAGVKNPVDLTVEGSAEQYSRTLEIAMKEYDAALVLYIGTPYLKSVPIVEGVIRAVQKTGKPIATAFAVGIDIEDSYDLLRKSEIPNYISGERVIKVFAHMAEYEAYRKNNRSLPIPDKKIEDIQFDGPMLEPDAKELLIKNGISVPNFVFCTTKEATIQACKDLGYPVVMKVVSPEILHKSDFGGVKLNIENDEKAAEVFDYMKDIAKGLDFRGVIVYSMLDKAREVILGLTRDPMFGPVVAFGLGGIYTEVLKDIVLRVAPVNYDMAIEMIKSIKTYAILKGVRGEKPADIEALADAIVKFSQIPFKYPNIEEADLNPVFVYEKGIETMDARILE